jgi:two-component system, LytTR family, sensor histidine kinase AlgZ
MGQDAGERRRQNLGSSLGALRVPDFGNLGTWLRILLSVNGLALVAALQASRNLAVLPRNFAELAAYVEPITFGALITLYGGRRWIERLAPPLQALAALAATLAMTSMVTAFLAPLDEGQGSLLRNWLLAAIIVVVLLVWFDLAARAHAPAVAEARLMALTARIRPHFLFNSLNAVLGVIRSDPRRAETALEELAELFRALMQENRDLVPLSAEISLSRQYLDLERLRLGDRLQVRWDIESCPSDALMPPLMLQPLIENAVYHGIEPMGEPGEISVRLAEHDGRLLVEIANPSQMATSGHHHVGNRMALANIRERLALFFDLEASLTTEVRNSRYLVRIELPYRREGAR